MNARFSWTELKELGISIIVITFVVAYTGNFIETLSQAWKVAIVIVPAFAFHEIGHKFAAQKYGFNAEYRMWKSGLFIAALLVVMFKWAFIAPGAVYFSAKNYAHVNQKDVGKIGFAGPLVNLGLVAVFGIISALVSNEIVSTICATGVYVNAFLAVFNLIPFGPLDGHKVRSWNRTYWGIALAIGLAALFWKDLLFLLS